MGATPPPIALTIAGSDPSGGAGVQADLKTFHHCGVYGATAVTLLTVQNTQGVAAVRTLEPDFVVAQLDAVLDDMTPSAAKTGALGSAAIIEAVAARLARVDFPLVIDPVMISKHGAPLMDAAAAEALRRLLLPLATVVTPNPHEAAVLSGIEVKDAGSMQRAAEAIAQLGPRHVLVKGGSLPHAALDLLWSDGRAVRCDGTYLDSRNTHGTGCVYSAAIAALLARGLALDEAVRRAQAFVARAIAEAPGIGHGIGPINLHAPVDLS